MTCISSVQLLLSRWTLVSDFRRDFLKSSVVWWTKLSQKRTKAAPGVTALAKISLAHERQMESSAQAFGWNRTLTRLSQLSRSDCRSRKPFPRKIMVALGCQAELLSRTQSCRVASRLSSPFFDPATHTRPLPTSSYVSLLPSVRVKGTWSTLKRCSGSQRPHLGLTYTPRFTRRRRQACHFWMFGFLVSADWLLELDCLRRVIPYRVMNAWNHPFDALKVLATKSP